MIQKVWFINDISLILGKVENLTVWAPYWVRLEIYQSGHPGMASKVEGKGQELDQWQARKNGDGDGGV